MELNGQYLTPAALASRMLQLSGALRRRAQPGKVTTNPSPPSPLLLAPSSRRSLANQSAESFSSAGGISIAPSPSRLQPPPPRGSRSRKKSGTSVNRKPKDPDPVPRAIVYPASSELQQRPSAGKETNTNQILRVEANTVRIEQMLQRMVEELRSSLMSASALRQQELLQASVTERTQMEARLMGSLRDDIRDITRSELKLLEVNLQQKLTSLLPMDAVNRLLSSLENTFTHLYDPVPPSQGPPSERPSMLYEPPQSGKLSSTHPKPVPSSLQRHTPRTSSAAQSPSLLTRLQDGPLSSQSETVSSDSKRSMIRAGKRRAVEHEEDGRDSKRRPYDARTAHSASVFLPSEWDPLPFTIDRIFTMYYGWSSDFDAAVHVTLPRVGFITRIGGDRLKLSFSPEGLEEFLRAWNAYHNVVPGLGNVVVCRDNAD
ncbi:uncharacterized protein C8R40DRAFT_1074997 [Lentinula edodes]|uniref:uncharacterized protein n=1 Tax=Lentinula edodes TaxID=5353 RepID=UPI001E8D0DFC|nr:uncharacterized protein C8R40DRAFT_1074997 [Lentinula edodes]KAH7868229.1 hypothetical protein C8R40DRAFT_1074997 [Lentinula edodes]